MKDLDGYQKGILIVMVVMALIFAFLYPKTISKVGYLYEDTILVATQQDGATVYAGKIQSQQAQFTVRDQTVSFRYGEKDYGEYTLKYDPTAVPKENGAASAMTGIEIRHDGAIFFRGGVLESSFGRFLYNEDGSAYVVVRATSSNGSVTDEDGNGIDSMTPSVWTIYGLLNEPELTHKGNGVFWFLGALVCGVNALYIFFAEELFYFKMSFRVRDAELAEPSEWEIATRYIGWTGMVLAALIIFVVGLQQIA